jgi:hypothetical protein
MDHTTRTRTTAVAGGTALAAGAAVILHGVIQQDLPRSLAGACLLLVSLTFVALALLHQWITDVSDQRRDLAEAKARADGERARYIALEGALEGEHAHLSRELAAKEARLAAQLEAERRALEVVFEERRAELICETTDAVVKMFHDGKLAPAPSAAGNVIRFPAQQPDHSRTREQEVHAP